MIAARAFEGRTVALFGLGGSGLATAQSLQQGGADVIAWDDNPDSVAKADAAGIATRDLREIAWPEIGALVLSPGVPLTHPKPHWSADLASRSGVEVIGDVELFARERQRTMPSAPFVAITGTNGKSTTTALIAHMLKSAGCDTQMGGNIGRAVLTLEPFSPGRHYVVECSSYQIDLAPSLDPTVGILLNVTPDHLDRHGTIERYAEIKERLVAKAGTAVVGVEDRYCARIADRLETMGKSVMRLSTTEPIKGLYLDGSDLCDGRGEGRRIASLDGIGSLRGRHNAQNALAAVAACQVLGLSDLEIQTGLRSFPGLAHRMEQVARRNGALFINDSKATNAEAAAPALSSFERVHWIAGGLPKSGGIDTLKPFFPRVEKAYLIGEAAPSFAATLGETVPYEISETLQAAVNHAARDVDGQEGAVVLLSPACASFDQFKNFELRGEAFRTAVLALPGVEPIKGVDLNA